MEALTTIQQFNLTKTQIDSMARQVLSELEDGYSNPVQIFIYLRAMEELIKKVKDGINDQVVEEAEKYGKEFTYKGAEIKLANRRTYDYSQDPIWANLDDEKKKREQLLKTLSEPLADPNTGELIYPAAFKVTPFLTITLPK